MRVDHSYIFILSCISLISVEHNYASPQGMRISVLDHATCCCSSHCTFRWRRGRWWNRRKTRWWWWRRTGLYAGGWTHCENVGRAWASSPLWAPSSSWPSSSHDGHDGTMRKKLFSEEELCVNSLIVEDEKVEVLWKTVTANVLDVGYKCLQITNKLNLRWLWVKATNAINNGAKNISRENCFFNTTEIIIIKHNAFWKNTVFLHQSQKTRVAKLKEVWRL